MQKSNTITAALYKVANANEQRYFRDTWRDLNNLSKRSFYTMLDKEAMIKDSYLFHQCTGKKYSKFIQIELFFPEIALIKSLDEMTLEFSKSASYELNTNP